MLRRLFDQMLWADELARQEIARLPEATPQAGRALAIYAHVAAAEHVWLSRIEGRAPLHPIWPTLSLDEAAALARASVSGLREHAADDENQLRREIVYRNSTGQEFRTALGDILLHVALHGAYHRGQLALLARDGAAEPANTDFITWARRLPAT